MPVTIPANILAVEALASIFSCTETTGMISEQILLDKSSNPSLHFEQIPPANREFKSISHSRQFKSAHLNKRTLIVSSKLPSSDVEIKLSV